MKKFYTEEMDAWLLENYSKFFLKDLETEFNKAFSTNVTFKALASHAHRKIGAKKTYGEISSLRRGIPHKTYRWNEEMQKTMEMYLSEGKTYRQIGVLMGKTTVAIRGHVKESGLQKVQESFYFTDEQVKWLKENYDKLTSDMLIDEVEKMTGHRYNKTALLKKIYNLGIHHSKDYLYNTRANICSAVGKSTKGTPYCKRVPVGTIRFRKRDNEYVICVNDAVGLKQYERWRRMSTYMYEKLHNCKVDTKKYKVIYLDGNKRNNSIENLALVTYADVARINQNHAYGMSSATEALVQTYKIEKLFNEFKKGININV